MQKSLQRQCEDNRRPPSKSGPTDSTAPAKDHDSDQRSCDGRWKARAEIALTEDSVACHLRPIGERGFVQPQPIIEVGNDVICALDHLSRCFRETRLVTIDQRQAPCAGQMKKDAAKK